MSIESSNQPNKGEISSAHLQPNLLSFSSAISACEKAGEWQKALYLLEATSRARISPDVIIHSVAWYSVGRFSVAQKGTGLTPVAAVLFHFASDWGTKPSWGF
jgi:pentatricopeptide repeat protein